MAPAQLPDFQDLGTVNPQPTGRLPQFAPSDPAAAAEGVLGKGLEQAGRTAETISAYGDIAHARMDRSLADASLYGNLIPLETQLKLERDPEKIQALSDQYQQVLANAGNAIRDPSARQMWLAEKTRVVTEGRASATLRLHDVAMDNWRGNLDETAGTIVRNVPAIAGAVPDALPNSLDQIDQLYGNAHDAGALTADQAYGRRQQARRELIGGSVLHALNANDPKGAQSVLDTYGNYLDPDQVERLQTRVQHVQTKLGVKSAIDGLWREFGGPAMPGVSSGATGPNSGLSTGGAIPAAITRQAAAADVDPTTALATAQIESRMGENLGRRGNIFQLGSNEWASVGGGDLGDPDTGIKNGVQFLAEKQKELSLALGRQPEGWETYLAHQQGTGGAIALLSHPDTPAGELVPPKNIKANGGDPNAPAADFVDKWKTAFQKAAARFAPIGSAQAAEPGPGAAASGSSPSFDLAFGDSIAVQQIRHGVGGSEGPQITGAHRAMGEGETAAVGAPPATVLKQMQAAGPDSFAGKTVFLSPGTSNDPSQLDAVGDQLQFLKSAGAKGVVVPGVGPGVPDHDQVNARLKDMADSAGFSFFEPNIRWQKDGIHPAQVDKLRAQAQQALGASTGGQGGGSGEPGSPPPASAGGAAGPATGQAPLPDLNAMLQRVQDKADKGELPQDAADAVMAGLRSRFNRLQSVQANARSALAVRLNNGQAQLADGGDFDWDPAEIRHYFPAEKADELVQQLQDAQQAGQMTVGIRSASPDQIAAQRDQLAAGLDQPNAPDYARRKRLLATYDQAVLAHWKALEDPKTGDPAAYLIATNPDLQKASAAIDPKVPQSFQDYATASLGEQARLGVDPAAQRVLTRQGADKLTGALTGDPEHAPATLKAMADQWGAAWPHVWSDLVTLGKLPAGYQVVGQLADYDQANAAILARALAAPEKDLRGFAGATYGGQKSVEQRITEAMNGSDDLVKYERSLSDSGASPGQVVAVRHAIRDLAVGRAMFQREDAADAAQKALDAVIGHYEFLPNGGARIPTANYAAVAGNARATLSGLSPDTIAVPPVFGAGPAAPKAQDYVAMVQAAPNWITGPQADRILLVDPMGRQVRDRGGNPISVPFTVPPLTHEPPSAAAISQASPF